MDEKRDALDTIATAISLGFCAVGLFMIIEAFVATARRREDEPEHITTSRGRKILVTGVSVFGVSDVSEPRRVHTVEPVKENNVEEIRNN